MQNKRGISQAFSALPPSKELVLRPATVFDVFDMSEVLVASITQLCQRDHLGDPECLAQWCGNKSPADIRGWIAAGLVPTVATSLERILGVGLVTPQAEVSLLYVAPWGKSRGVGGALLKYLEAELAAQGHAAAHSTATNSGLGFYLSQGWQVSGASTNCFGLPGHPMRKLLQPAP